jgi:hypothetical protein
MSKDIHIGDGEGEEEEEKLKSLSTGRQRPEYAIPTKYKMRIEIEDPRDVKSINLSTKARNYN